MMKPVRLISGLTLFFLFCYGCNPKGQYKLSGTNCKDEVQLLENLEFTFDQNLVADSLVNRWLDEAYVTFQPPIPGKFRWESNYRLVFSPEKPLQAATSYQAVLRTDLGKTVNLKWSGNSVFKFHTPLQSLLDYQAYWKKTASGSIEAHVQLTFSAEQSPELLEKLLTVKSGKQNLGFKILTAEQNSRVLDLSLSGLVPSASNQDLQLVIAQGLAPKKGKLKTTESLQAEVELFSPKNIELGEIKTEHDGVEGVLRINTSQTIEDDALKSKIQFDPAVDFTVEQAVNQLIIRSPKFAPNYTYQLHIASGVKGELQGVLSKEYTALVTFSDPEPELSLAEENAMYLSAGGNKNIAFKIVNIPRVKVVISRIYANNIPAAMRYGYYPEDDGEDYAYGEDYSPGEVIANYEVNTASLPKNKYHRLLHLDLNKNTGKNQGIYHVRVSSTENYWNGASTFFSLSDLGLIARASENEMMVFVNSLASTKPVSNIEVNLIGRNGQTLGTARTNADGKALIPFESPATSGQVPALITAAGSGDFNYMQLSKSLVETSRFDVGGRRTVKGNLDAYLYAERNIYRPGEEMHFALVCRKLNQEIPKGLPVRFVLIAPNGKEINSFDKLLDAQGTTDISIKTNRSGITGTYTVQAYTAGNVVLSSMTVMVEEFMPDKIRVIPSVSTSVAKPGDSIRVNLLAENLYGNPASGNNYEIEMQLNKAAFQAKGFEGYSFDLNSPSLNLESSFRLGLTDAQGKATETFAVAPELSGNGLMEAAYFITVFDETGRSVNRKKTVQIHTQNVYAGIGENDYYGFGVNQPADFPLALLNRNGQAVAGQVKVRVILYEYKPVLSSGSSSYRYESQQTEVVVLEKEIALTAGKNKFTFVPKVSCSYQFEVYLPGSKNFVSKSFYAYTYGSGNSRSFEVNKDGEVSIEQDKPIYAPGEKARLLFKTPFEGKLLITLEGESVKDAFYLETKNRTASAQISIPADYVPNIYVTATLFKAHRPSENPMTAAHGYRSVAVIDPGKKLEIKLDCPDKIRSNMVRKVTVKASPGAALTFAAVDEGILQMTDFKTPDAYEHYYARRALLTKGYDLYTQLFPEYRNNLKSTGGDGFDLSKRVNPLPARPDLLLSYWSGVKVVPASGLLEFEVPIPPFAGEIRLMANAVKDASFGAVSKSVKVADPVVITAGIPRFMAPGDTALVKVNLVNTTQTPLEVQIEGNGSGKVSFLKKSGKISLPAGASSSVLLPLLASKSVGEGTVSVKAVYTGGQTLFNDHLSVRPASAFSSETYSGQFSANTPLRLTLNANDFLTATASFELIAGTSPLFQWSKELFSVYDYPYSCTEQLISAGFAALKFDEVLRTLSTRKKSITPPGIAIERALNAIAMRQQYSGGITLWNQNEDANWWLTAYAAHFLFEAKKAGYKVMPDVLNESLNYLKQQLSERNQNLKSKTIIRKEVAYSLLVLAIHQQTDKGLMNYYGAKESEFSPGDRVLLAAAYALNGNAKKLNPIASGITSAFDLKERKNNESFSSGWRDAASALYALSLVKPDDPATLALARFLNSGLQSEPYLNTQENAFILLAFGELAEHAQNQQAQAVFQVEGLPSAKLESGRMVIHGNLNKNTAITANASGSGTVFYSLRQSGVKLEPAKEKDQFLKVRRTFFNRNGQRITGNNFKQNELVVVEIELASTLQTPVDQIAISDLLPAGFEIENSRIKEVPGMNWIKDAAMADETDIRDDRMILFTSLSGKPKKFYYVVRAVSPGNYLLPAVHAEAMYNPEYHSQHGGGRIRIQ